jgi:hypothetical protein
MGRIANTDEVWQNYVKWNLNILGNIEGAEIG